MDQKLKTLDYIVEKYHLDFATRGSKLDLQGGGRGNLARLWQELGFKTGAEIGVESGRFSRTICALNPGVKLYCIDPWHSYPGYREHVSQAHQNGLYRDALKRTHDYNCEILRGYSMDVVKKFADGSLDFVYIDANHDYKNVTDDITHWSKKVHSGGIISGHDYNHSKVGVRNDTIAAVNGYVKQHKITPYFVWLGDSAPSWMWVKT